MWAGMPSAAELSNRARHLDPIDSAAVHACELGARQLRVAPRVLDGWLWNRGQQARYKALPRHRTRTTAY